MARARRTLNVPLIAAAVATLLAVAAVAALRGSKTAARLEGATVDARFAVRGEREPATDRIVVVGIDDETRAVAPELMQTRNGWVTFLDKLTAYDPAVIALDLFFSAPEVVLPDELAKQTLATQQELLALPAPQPDAVIHARDTYAKIADLLRSDEHLAAAIARSKRVYLGSFLYGAPPAAPAPQPEPPGLALAHHGEVADANAGGELRPATTAYANYTLDAMAAGAVGGGLVNRIEDPDGEIRRVPLAVLYDTRVYMPLGLAVALAGMARPGDTRYVVGDDHLVAGGKSIELGKSASVTLDVLGKQRFPRISAADIWTGKTPAAALKGKLVFVGFTYAAFDKVDTAFDTKADGVELHATLAENLLTDHLMHERGGATTLLVTALLGGIVTLAQLRRVRRRAYLPPLVAIVAIAGYLVVAYLAFAHRNVIVEVAAPVLATGAVLLCATIGGLATEGREKALLRAAFGQYVSRAVVDRIVSDPARAKLGGERKDLTVLFSDIRGFSLFSEGMAPEDLAQLLSDYLTPMTDLVLESAGTLDKYIGDAVMAIWGAPIELPDHAARACEVALRMQEVLVELNRKWAGSGRPEIAIGIGLNTGPMAVGNMGTAARFDYTVLGDHVNLAARLEALTKEYGVAILVGEGTMRAAGDKFVFREVDLVRVKGRAGAAPVYELVGRAGAALDPAFAAALAHYRAREFAAARAAFAALGETDKVAQILAARCEQLAAAPPDADWDGVYEQRSK